MFQRVQGPTTTLTGVLETDVTVAARAGDIPLAVVWGSRAFFAPPIPKEMDKIAQEVLPQQIRALNHGKEDLRAILPRDDLDEKLSFCVETLFEKKSPWTGYIIYKLDPAQLCGMAMYRPGFSKDDNIEREHSYQASESEMILSIDLDVREEDLFEQVVVVMLIAAKFFIAQRRGQVTRIVIPYTSKASVSRIFLMQDWFLKRIEVLEKIFGPPLGVIASGDVRNISVLDQEVYGADTDKLNDLIDRYFRKG